MTSPIKEATQNIIYYVPDAARGMEEAKAEQERRLRNGLGIDWKNSPLVGGKVLLDSLIGVTGGLIAGGIIDRQFNIFERNAPAAVMALLIPAIIGNRIGNFWEPAKIGRQLRKRN